MIFPGSAAKTSRRLVSGSQAGARLCGDWVCCDADRADDHFDSPAPGDGRQVHCRAAFPQSSRDKTNTYFAEGLEDDIVSRLVKIQDLKVISRLSSSRYPANSQRDLPAIGRSLGVRNVLEGSFNRRANRILLNVALVDTRTGDRIWTQKYDRDLADVITLQGDLVAAIAGVLDATISPQEELRVRKKSTGKPDATSFFARAKIRQHAGICDLGQQSGPGPVQPGDRAGSEFCTRACTAWCSSRVSLSLSRAGQGPQTVGIC